MTNIAQSNKLVRIFSFENLDPSEPDTQTHCMNICRKTLDGRGLRVVIPVSLAYQYVENDELHMKAMQYAQTLYEGAFTKSQVMGICNCIDDGLRELIMHKPAPEKSQADIENEMDRLDLVLTVGGEKIIDASG